VPTAGACTAIPIGMCILAICGCCATSGGASSAADHPAPAAAPSGWGPGIAGTGVSRAQRGVIGINIREPGPLCVLVRVGCGSRSTKSPYSWQSCTRVCNTTN
jgi:hypothetical protein